MAPPAPAGIFSNRYKLEDIPDLSGKVAIVTGGTRGIGESLVTALAKKNAEVHILGATPEHGKEAIEKVESEAPGSKSKLHYHQVDLGSLKSVQELGNNLSQLPRIDLLFLIAGIGAAPFGLTTDGLGNHFAVNHLAHFLLTDEVLPKMIETSKSKQGKGEREAFSTRIVVESSELHRACPSDLRCESVEEFNTELDPTKLYGRSKMLGILFIKELVKHLPALDSANPIMAISVHPGAVATEQQHGATEAYGKILGKALETAASLGFMDPSQGAESACWAGTGDSVVDRRFEVQGQYFTEADGKVGTESDQGKNAALSKGLWDVSVKTLKDKIGYEVKM